MKLVRYSFGLAYILSILSWSILSFASHVTTHVDSKMVRPGEPIQLTLELDENAPSGLPDFSPLAYDFYVQGTAHRAAYSFVNGQSKASTSWTVTLLPKSAGEVTIPAIQIGQARSQPITIQVSNHNGPSTQGNSRTDASSPDIYQNAPGRPIFIETSLSTEAPYINQEVIYAVKIYHNANLLDSSYQQPQLVDALLLPMNDHRQYQVIKDGEMYWVEEQRYAYFPQKSGHSILFGPKLHALIFDDIPRKVQAEGESITLNVQSIPKNSAADTWLPARKVQLRSNFANKAQQIQTGDTLKRTITIKTWGLPSELIPPIQFESSDDFNIYSDKPELSNHMEDGHVVGQATYTIQYLFKNSGSITIPEIEIPWFDTLSKTTQIAHLKATHYDIKANADYTIVSPSEGERIDAPSIQEVKQEKPSKEMIEHALTKRMYTLGVFLFLLFIGYSISRYQQHKHHQKLTKKAFKQVKRYTLSQDALGTQAALLKWAKLAYRNHSILNLQDICEIVQNEALTNELAILSHGLYDLKKQTEWSGLALWKALKAIWPPKQSKRSKKQSHFQSKQQLPPMNPIS